MYYRKIAGALLIVVAIMITFAGGMVMSSIAYADSKKAIVVVSFGTTYPETRKACIESIEGRIAAAFPEYEIRRAFTSRMVIKKIATNEQIQIDTMEQALDTLRAEGFSEVVIQPTHLTPGEEYDNKIVGVMNAYTSSFEKMALGRPLLFHQGDDGQPDDFAIVVEALKTQMPQNDSGKMVVLMGHGSPNRHNPAYGLTQDRLDKAGINALVGVVEESDHPNFKDVQELLSKRQVKQVLLMPFLVVAGDHAANDMAGEDETSWKSILLRQGYQVETYMHGLGENPALQDIYVQHVRDAIATMK